MEQRLNIITLGVRDLDKSRSFYESVLDWKKSSLSNEGIIFYELNGLLLSLYPKDKLAEDTTVASESEGFTAFTMAYTSRSKEEVDEIIEQVELKGGRIVKKPEEAFWGGYSSYIADPDGNLWEIAFNPFIKLDEEGNILFEK